jgi:3'-phosphoadenosine 5'-phosphosulfate sulfotransferase (PAPS reductase)/FAD synthetase
MSADPFIIDGPTLWSFSGGRTSAYMLWRALQAYGGKLPDNHVVAFANTGKEREETLRFVYECGSRWGVEIVWLEWVNAKPCFQTVGFNSAARNGEPFAALIDKKGYLPNAVARFCTQELKIRTIRDYCRSIGWDRWKNAVGLRHDEGHRVLKALARNHEAKERFTAAVPLANAKVTVRDVKAFWDAQPFDLGLRHYEGNCDLCFLKGRGSLKAIMREQPGSAEWWAEREVAVTTKRATKSGARFVTEYSYADLAREVAQQPHLFDEPLDDEHDAECGLWCAGEAA